MIVQFPSIANMPKLPLREPKSTLPAYVERFAHFLRVNASSKGGDPKRSKRSWKTRSSKRKASSKIIDIAHYLNDRQ